METRQELTDRAREAARRVDMVALLGSLGVKTSRLGAQITLPCPWGCGGAKGKAFVWQGTVKCFGCGRHEDSIGIVRLLTGCDYKTAVAELALGAGEITDAEAATIIGKNTSSASPKPVPVAVKPAPEPTAQAVERADAEVLDAFYRTMARVTGLTAEHKEHLVKVRGLKSYRIKEYCDWPAADVERVVAAVRKAYGDDTARRVTEQLGRIPGVVEGRCGGYEWAFSGRPGIALLTVDDDEHAVGVQIRSDDDDDDGKYVWLSSKARGGSGPGAPSGWIPAGKSEAARTAASRIGYRCPAYRDLGCVIVEGKYKAEALAARGLNAIYVSGVTCWHPAMEMVRRKCAPGALVAVAYDADAAEKPQVAEQRDALAEALLEAGFRPVVWLWALEAGKGVDDVLLAGGEKEIHVTPYKEAEWAGPSVRATKASGQGTTIAPGTVGVYVLDALQERNDGSGWTLATCRRPLDNYGPAVAFRRLPVWREGACVKLRVRVGEKGLEADDWAPALESEVWSLYGITPDEPPRGPAGSKKTPARRLWESAQKSVDATRFLSVACEVDTMCSGERADGGMAGIPISKIELALEKWDLSAADALRLSPYKAGRALGVSLQLCDRIAGVKPGDPAWLGTERLAWASVWAIDYATDCGSTRVPYDEVMRKLRRYCQCTDGDPDPRLVLDPPDGEPRHRIETEPDGTKVIVHGRLAQIEKKIAENLGARRAQGEAPALGTAGEAALLRAQAGLTADQHSAVKTLLAARGVAILTGGPGTGKTHTLAIALDVYTQAHPGAKIRLCATTGHAAQRLAEATGRDASTIHAMLGIKPYATGVLAADVEADLVICDEVSMGDIGLIGDLLSCVPLATQIWLCGDADQLEAVGPGAFLRDVLAEGRGVVSISRLTVVHRQSEGSAIIDAARGVLAGREPVSSSDCFISRRETSEAVEETVLAWCKKVYHIERPFDCQVLCLTHVSTTRDREHRPVPGGTVALNRRIQEAVNPPREGEPELHYGTTTYRLHDKILITRNRSSDGQLVYSNGDQGIVTGLGPREMTVRLQSGREVTLRAQELADVQLAYAMTVHKAQGSGYEKVLICLPQSQTDLFPGLTRNLLYTAITRASKNCAICHSGDALQKCVQAPAGTRRTGLQAQLRRVRGDHSSGRFEDEDGFVRFSGGELQDEAEEAISAFYDAADSVQKWGYEDDDDKRKAS